MKNIKTKLSLFLIAVSTSSFVVGDDTFIEREMSSSTVIVDDVRIEIKVNKSTIETLKFSELSEEHLAGTFLPGAFEPTAAGEIETTNVVTQNVNDDALLHADKSRSKAIAERQVEEKKKSNELTPRDVRFTNNPNLKAEVAFEVTAR